MHGYLCMALQHLSGAKIKVEGTFHTHSETREIGRYRRKKKQRQEKETGRWIVVEKHCKTPKGACCSFFCRWYVVGSEREGED